ncbi:MAG TPA: SDR family NAD(P)-dependent oxidoreductase, partial [Pseudonocardia sp.]
MDLRLADKTAVVTGAGRGIGLAVTKALANEGVRVVGAARTLSPELKQFAAVAVSADLSTREGAEAVVAEAVSALGGVDIVVNNVGAGDT